MFRTQASAVSGGVAETNMFTETCLKCVSRRERSGAHTLHRDNRCYCLMHDDTAPQDGRKEKYVTLLLKALSWNGSKEIPCTKTKYHCLVYISYNLHVYVNLSDLWWRSSGLLQGSIFRAKWQGRISAIKPRFTRKLVTTAARFVYHP